MVVAVIDDHRLLDLLSASDRPPGRYATTCAWWWRLTSALAGHRHGALTSRIRGVDDPIVSALRRTVSALPRHVEIVDLRLLVPAMGVLAQSYQVNLLAAEAIAAAAYLEASIEVEIDTPQIREAARSTGVDYRVIRAA